MCVAVPYKVLAVDDGRAEVEAAGVRQEVSLAMLPDVAVGDWVLVYLGAVAAVIDEAEAMEVLRLFEELAQLEAVPR